MLIVVAIGVASGDSSKGFQFQFGSIGMQVSFCYCTVYDLEIPLILEFDKHVKEKENTFLIYERLFLHVVCRFQPELAQLHQIWMSKNVIRSSFSYSTSPFCFFLFAIWSWDINVSMSFQPIMTLAFCVLLFTRDKVMDNKFNLMCFDWIFLGSVQAVPEFVMFSVVSFP